VRFVSFVVKKNGDHALVTSPTGCDENQKTLCALRVSVVKNLDRVTASGGRLLQN